MSVGNPTYNTSDPKRQRGPPSPGPRGEAPAQPEAGQGERRILQVYHPAGLPALRVEEEGAGEHGSHSHQPLGGQVKGKRENP